MIIISIFEHIFSKPKYQKAETVVISIPADIYCQELALYTVSSLIGNAISKSEMLCFRDGKAVKNEDYYRLNVSPNENETSSYFWHTYCDGFACSAASIIFVAGDERIIGKLGMLMVHNCMSYAGYANADELRKIADDTEKINQASIEAYKAVCSVDENKIKELMNEESWLTADEALEYGFATSIAEPEQENSVQQSATAALRNSILNEKNRDGRIEQLINKVSELIETVKPKEKDQKIDTTNDLKQAFVDFFNFYK